MSDQFLSPDLTPPEPRPAGMRRPVKDLPLTRLLPNILTMLSLCSGLTAIHYAVLEQWQGAVLAILIASVFDMLDGRVARMLNIASKFGAELDSLSDAISFGVAPGFIMYLWVMKDSVDLGWIAVLVFVVCAAMRLARFNTMLEDHTLPQWTKRYFIGLPTPAGAALALLPLTLVLQFGPMLQLPAAVVSIWLMLVGGMMISRLPSFALKGWRIAPMWVAPIFVGVLLLVAGLVTHPFLVIALMSGTYAISLPFGFITFYRRMRQELSHD